MRGVVALVLYACDCRTAKKNVLARRLVGKERWILLIEERHLPNFGMSSQFKDRYMFR